MGNKIYNSQKGGGRGLQSRGDTQKNYRKESGRAVRLAILTTSMPELFLLGIFCSLHNYLTIIHKLEILCTKYTFIYIWARERLALQ